MTYDFKILKEKAKGVEDWLRKEYMVIRTGMASPAILDNVLVESYGQRMQINQVGSIAIEDARVLRISAWDKSQTKEIEKAITAANLGVSVQTDDKGVRVFFPELTSERRDLLKKTAKSKLEDARVSLRSIRDEVWDDIQEKEKEGGMGEDEKFRFKNEMQKIIDETSQSLETILEKKEKEIDN